MLLSVCVNKLLSIPRITIFYPIHFSNTVKVHQIQYHNHYIYIYVSVYITARLIPDIVEGLMLSSENPLNFHAMIVSVSPVGILKVL